VVHGGDEDEFESLFGSVRQGGLTVEAAYIGRDKNNPMAPYGTVFGKQVHTFDARGFLEGRYEWQVRDDLRAMARLTYDRYEFWADYPYDFADVGAPSEIVINRDESLSESVGSEVQLNWKVSERQDVTLGAEYRFDFRVELRNFNVSPRTDYLDLDRDVRSFAFYLQDEYRPLTNLAFTAGVRLDHYDTFGDAVNPRLACVYSPLDTTTLKFLYGTAFRAPNGSELYYQDNGLSTKLNPDLKPEEVSTYEIVCEQKLGKHWRGSVAGFWNTVRDLINTAQEPDDGLYYYENLDQVDARGLEFQLDGQLTRDLRGRASYTLTKTEDNATGESLNNSPEHLAKLNLTAPVFADWLFAGGEVQYMSERTTVDGNEVGNVLLVNATLFAYKLRDTWDISLSVYNLFDTQYRDPASTPDTVEQDGRTLRLKLVAHF
jgi:iron complex outermembrane receptor protein